MLYFGSLNHAQDQGINGQTACPLLEGERTYGRHREIDAIDPERKSQPLPMVTSKVIESAYLQSATWDALAHLPFPRPLPEHKFLHLAGRGLGQLAEHDVPGALEAGHLALAPGDELLGRWRLDAPSRSATNAQGVSPQWESGLATTATSRTAGMAGEDLLDLQR